MKIVLTLIVLVFSLNNSFAKNVALVIGMAEECSSCQADAQVMEQILKSELFDVHVLMDTTPDVVVDFIQKQSEVLGNLDMFVLYFSGHGGFSVDLKGDEIDGMDEYWVMQNNTHLLDDTIYALLSKFDFGVKILFLSDSCHSGTMYKKNPTFYKLNIIPEQLKADLIAITSSQDNETSLMANPFSKFTGSLVEVWNEGNFTGNYLDFYNQIYKINLEDEHNGRHVQYHSEGPTISDFENKRPFIN